MYVPSPFERITPVVSAALTDGGTIVSVPSSYIGVRSPFISLISGARFVTATPLQSVTLILTGSTWPFFSLSVTGWFVIGGRNSPVPILTVVDAVSKPPSSSVTLTVAALQPAEANAWVTCWPLTKGLTVWLSGLPSAQVKNALQASAPGSVKSVVNVLVGGPLLTNELGPYR